MPTPAETHHPYLRRQPPRYRPALQGWRLKLRQAPSPRRLAHLAKVGAWGQGWRGSTVGRLDGGLAWRRSSGAMGGGRLGPGGSLHSDGLFVGCLQ